MTTGYTFEVGYTPRGCDRNDPRVQGVRDVEISGGDVWEYLEPHGYTQDEA